MKITYLGTTVLLFDDGIHQILFDAHVSRYPVAKVMFGKVKTKEDEVKAYIERFNMHRVEAIFISHTHIDHVMDLPAFANLCQASVYGSKSAVNVALGGNVPIEMCHEFHHNDCISIGDYKIHIIESIHSKTHWYNDDLGKTIERPLQQPARKKDYKEGGSFDFLVEHRNKRYLIRPSFNYIPHQLDGITADYLYLGIAGITKASKGEKKEFFLETIDKVKPSVVIPIHWDNFFKSLESDASIHSKWPTEDPKRAFEIVREYCNEVNVEFKVQLPLESIEV